MVRLCGRGTLRRLTSLFTTTVLFLVGIVLLTAGAEVLVRGASHLSVAAGISPLVVGLTVVAYATSAPELAVSVQAALAGQPGVATGNIVGSNISNILLILGLSAVAAPLIVHQQIVRLDVPLMIGVSVIALLMSWNGLVSTLEGWLLVAGALVFTVFVIRKSRRETREIVAEYEQEFGVPETERHGAKRIVRDLLLIAGGLVMLLVGARMLVSAATTTALALGVSEVVIGLTVIAVGTSLPELATSLVASIRGERDIAVGNIVGSNLFNLLFVLGSTAVVIPTGITVDPIIVGIDMPIMIGASLLCLPIFAGHRVTRWEGLLFLLLYVAYVTYVLLRATEHAWLETFSDFMLWFGLPFTVLAAALSWYHARHVGAQRG
ncbi:MAG TPA: calcium/sodium antiporter [Gemmatimonadaceae bacterium]|nr:calcium/sodium antiporter [Gemmatimonadaceae bacterium]